MKITTWPIMCLSMWNKGAFVWSDLLYFGDRNRRRNVCFGETNFGTSQKVIHLKYADKPQGHIPNAINFAWCFLFCFYFWMNLKSGWMKERIHVYLVWFTIHIFISCVYKSKIHRVIQRWVILELRFCCCHPSVLFAHPIEHTGWISVNWQ